MKSVFLLFTFVLFSCNSLKNDNEVAIYKSKTLVINQISNHVYEHTSYLQTESFGKVPCNGMIVIDGGEAIVFDTPVDDKTSRKLIDWITKKQKSKIKAVVATHFHDDCLGGLNEFHSNKIPSYSQNLTIELARNKGYAVPQNGIDQSQEFQIGNQKVYAEFFGQGHTKDNIIGYFPAEKTMFGGCLIKEIGAGKGYLGDANINDWSETVRKIKAKYPEAKTIIPGHGKIGGIELLDYTIQLFEK